MSSPSKYLVVVNTGRRSSPIIIDCEMTDLRCFGDDLRCLG